MSKIAGKHGILAPFFGNAGQADGEESLTICGVSEENGEDGYQVGESEAGAGGSQMTLRLFKIDSENEARLSGAKFNLYVTDVTRPTDYNPPSYLN